MRLLLDECIDERLRHAFAGHDCETARYAHLAGLKNGRLLLAAGSAGFNVIITVDQNIPDQQNLAGRSIGLLIICAPTNRLRDLMPLIPAALAAPGCHAARASRSYLLNRISCCNCLVAEGRPSAPLTRRVFVQGSIPILSPAYRGFCLQPGYCSVVWMETCPGLNRICSSSPPATWHSRAQVPESITLQPRARKRPRKSPLTPSRRGTISCAASSRAPGRRTRNPSIRQDS
jgi:hypothetical protein